jgi:alpha-beta hydrolase superfamily lysophospholipase
VVWGHSQGGGAALWTGQLAPTYAPDVNVIGVAALAPASNLTGLVSNLDAVPGGSIFASYVFDSYSAVCPDVRYDDYIRPQARTLVHEMATRCLAKPSALVSVVESLVVDGPIFATDPSTGALGARLAENVPDGDIPAPLFLGQGAADSLVLPAAQREYVAARCAAGQPLEYREYEWRDHVPLVEPDSPLVPDLFAWTEARLAGDAPVSTCPS